MQSALTETVEGATRGRASDGLPTVRPKRRLLFVQFHPLSFGRLLCLPWILTKNLSPQSMLRVDRADAVSENLRVGSPQRSEVSAHNRAVARSMQKQGTSSHLVPPMFAELFATARAATR